MKSATTMIMMTIFLFTAAACTPMEDINDAQIYAAVIQQIYTVDHSFGAPENAPGWPFVYVLSATEDVDMDATRASSQKLSIELQEAVTAELADKPFELIWIEEIEDAPINQTDGRIAQGDGIIITLGNITPQYDGSVQLAFYMNCGGLCGIGKTYVLNQINGDWQITGSVGPEIMS